MQDSFFQKIFLLKISFKKVEETGCSPVWAAAHLFRLPTTQVATICSTTRVAEVVRGNGGPPPKSLDSDENFKPEHTLFCRELRFVAIYAHFGDFGQKSVILGQKQLFLHKKCTITWYILHILLS